MAIINTIAIIMVIGAVIIFIYILCRARTLDDRQREKDARSWDE
jgi:hypothetical protein|nr:MAG TPA: Protocadherin-15, LHFPL tetraspan subfamily member, LHFPL5, protocadherin, tip link [Caudoviricetes sp.]